MFACGNFSGDQDDEEDEDDDDDDDNETNGSTEPPEKIRKTVWLVDSRTYISWYCGCVCVFASVLSCLSVCKQWSIVCKVYHRQWNEEGTQQNNMSADIYNPFLFKLQLTRIACHRSFAYSSWTLSNPTYMYFKWAKQNSSSYTTVARRS